MTTPLSAEMRQPRDTAFWADELSVLKVERAPTGALNLNVEGHEVLSPLQGFGQLWQKVYQAKVKNATVTPTEIVSVWKEKFPQFWPKGNRFYAPPTGITPGAVALLSIGEPSIPGGLGMISTGVFVLYADDESFTFMTPQGHLFASWITFSAYEQDDCIVIQIHMLLRADDPLYEMGMQMRVIPFFEDRFWRRTLTQLMAHFNVYAPVQITATCIDRHLQWSQVGNIWHNVFISQASRASSSNRHLLLFRIVAVIIALLFIGVTGSEFIPAWILGDPTMSIHLWHIAELLALLAILLGGTLLSLVHQPEERPLLAQFFVLSMIIGAIALMPFEIKAGALLIIMVLFIAVYPSFRALLSFPRQGPISFPLLAISLLMAWLLAPVAYRELQWQILGMATHDVHALELHWIGSVLLMGLLVLGGILSATRRPGWKILSIITGLTYCYLGVTAMLLQDGFAGSWSGGYGLIAIIAGGWYIIGSFAGARLLREAEAEHKQALAVTNEVESCTFAAPHNEIKTENEARAEKVQSITRNTTRTDQLPPKQELMKAV